MENRELLRRVCAALDIDQDGLGELISLAGLDAEIPGPDALLGATEEDPEMDLDDAHFVSLLDALIQQRRGATDTAPPPAPLNNNLVLKKLRIALGMRDPEMMATFARAGVHLGRNQLGAMFRAPGNKHFQACSDGRLLCFLTGLRRDRERGEG
jgi:uncharacterized protein YehS (DUF1456 family)